MIGACTRCAARRIAADALGVERLHGTPAIGRFRVTRPISRVVTEDRLCAEHVRGLRAAGYKVEPMA